VKKPNQPNNPEIINTKNPTVQKQELINTKRKDGGTNNHHNTQTKTTTRAETKTTRTITRLPTLPLTTIPTNTNKMHTHILQWMYTQMHTVPIV